MSILLFTSIVFVSVLFTLFYKMKSPLKNLLTLELLSVSLLTMMAFSILWTSVINLMVFFTLMVMEGAFGLTILVKTSSAHAWLSNSASNLLW